MGPGSSGGFLTFLIAAGVAFLLPGSGADGAAWALLVLALACITAFASHVRADPTSLAGTSSDRRVATAHGATEETNVIGSSRA